MKKAKKRRIIWLILGILASVSCAVGTVLLAWLSLAGHYVWAVVVGLVTAHGYYGIPFYFGAMARTRVDIAITEATLEGKLSYSEISDATGYTRDALGARLPLCIKRGYITGYTLIDDGLVKSE